MKCGVASTPNKAMEPDAKRTRGSSPRRSACARECGILVVMKFKVEVEREEDGRWIAEVDELPGVLVYGDSVEQAQARAQALALRVLADRLEHGEAAPFESVTFAAA
jgi:predicted RNase H-like HicB family nuclease